MTTKLVALVLLCLMTGTAVAQEAKVVPLAEARLGRIGFDEWFRRSQAAA